MKKITVNDIMNLMPYTAVVDLEEDNFVQFIDNDTGAHYRMKNGVVLLGGDHTDMTLEDLYRMTVISIEYNNGYCELWIEG